MKKIFLVGFLFLFLSLPILTQAGLVPCGWADPDPSTKELEDPDPKTSYNEAKPCEFCDFFVLFNNIVKFVMTTLVPVIAVLMLVIGGVLFFLAGAKPDTLNQAKGIITSVVIGILIIFSAWIIVNTLLNFSGIVSSPSLLRWYEIDCSI